MKETKILRKCWFFIILVLMAFLSFNSTLVFADLIVDNGDINTSHTGTWDISSGVNPYGSNSLWARDGATYTWHFSGDCGHYEILMWWTDWPSRDAEIPVDINYLADTARIYINQQESCGQWNSLGQFHLCSALDNCVTITAQSGSTSTSADAIWFRTTPEPATIIFLSLGFAVLRFRKRT